MIDREPFRGFLNDFRKQEVELQINWNGGSTRGIINRVCEDCIILTSVGNESGFVYLIALENIASIRIDDPDQVKILTESENMDVSADESSGPISIKPLR